MKMFHLKRLERLEKIVEGIKSVNFDMDFFCETADGEFARHNYELREKINKGCGTVGCALGWAGFDPKFRKAGLRTNVQSGDVLLNSNIENYEAGEEFFGISQEETLELFSPDRYPFTGRPIRKASVLSRIRKLIKKKRKLFQKDEARD